MTEIVQPPLPRSQISEIEETGIMKVFLHSVGRRDIIPFWAGEGDVPTPDFICQAVTASLTADHAGEPVMRHSGVDCA